jgi:Fe-S cluster biogenesis protein NfuA
VTDVYGAALERVLALAAELAPELVGRLAEDELVASVLLVHGLHPDDLTVRVERGLAAVRPFLAQHGGDVELLDVDADAGAVLLRLLGSCDGCPSSAVTLQLAVETAVVDAAPEITTIDVERPSTTPPAGTTVPVSLTPKRRYEECPSELASP